MLPFSKKTKSISLFWLQNMSKTLSGYRNALHCYILATFWQISGYIGYFCWVATQRMAEWKQWCKFLCLVHLTFQKVLIWMHCISFWQFLFVDHFDGPFSPWRRYLSHQLLLFFKRLGLELTLSHRNFPNWVTCFAIILIWKL